MFTSIYHYNCEKYIHETMFAVLNTRHKVWVSTQLIFAWKKDWYKSQENDLPFMFRCSRIRDLSYDTSMYRYTASLHKDLQQDQTVAAV